MQKSIMAARRFVEIAKKSRKNQQKSRLHIYYVAGFIPLIDLQLLFFENFLSVET